MERTKMQVLAMAIAAVAAVGTVVKAEDAASAPVDKKVSIAVIDFRLSDVLNDKIMVTVSRKEGEDNKKTVWENIRNETGILTDKFVVQLVQTRKFNVVERKQLAELVGELEFSNSGMADPKSAEKMKKMLGADYYLMGTLGACDCTISHKAVPFTDNKFYKKVVEGSLIADMRLVETETGKIKQAQTGKIKRQHEETVKDASDTSIPPDFVDNLRNELVKQLVAYVIDACYPIKVVSTSEEVVYLNRGEDGGLEKGLKLTAFAQGKELRDPDTGALLGTEESRVAELEVTEVQAKLTKAKVLRWTAEKKELPAGTVCRRPAPGEEAKKEETTDEGKEKPRLTD